MDEITSIAAMSTNLQQTRIDVEVALRTMKMASEQEQAVLELLLKTMQMAVSGLGQYVDVRA
jgi:hypothetical protein